MRSAAVVVMDVDTEDVLKLPASDDQQPVEALAAHAADPALHVRARVRRLDGRADDLDVLDGRGGGRYVGKPYPGRIAVFRGPGYVTPTRSGSAWPPGASIGTTSTRTRITTSSTRGVELLATRLDEALSASGRD